MAHILNRLGMAYVAPARTGSTTILSWLDLYERKRTFGGIRHRLENLPQDMFTVISVRNPYTRVPSMWSYLTMRGVEILPFAEWVDKRYGSKRRKWSGWSSLKTTMVEHLRPMLDQVGFVIHVENMEKDLRLLADKLDLPWKLVSSPKHVIPKKFRLPDAERTSELMEMIGDKSREDFDRFGYEI